MSLLSVLIPMRNAEPYVAAALDSVLSQRDVQLEVVIIDDGSTDRSVQIVEQINDPRVRIIRGPRKGIAAAFNAGLAAARGEIRVVELPYRMRSRAYGESKLGARVIAEFFMLLLYHLSGRLLPARFFLFAAVGVTGMGVHLCVLWLLFARSSKTRRGPTWDCGLRGLTPHMEYTATGFSKPIRMIFKALFRPRRDVQREYDFSPYFATTIRFESHVEEVFERRIYRPLRIWILRASRRIRAIQAGSIHVYLLYIFVTLLLLLLFAL